MDKIRLEYEIKKSGLTISKLCSLVGISKSAYYRKCNGTSEFRQKEIQKIIDVLGITTPVGIFFTENVS